MDTEIKQLPKGRIYQKKGNRLESAVYNAMPHHIKNNMVKNHIDFNECGDAIVEYDMLYTNGDMVIGFEVKGINDKLCANNNHRKKIIDQAEKQNNHLKSINQSAKTVFCFVTGNANMDMSFAEDLESRGIITAIGKFPKNVVKDAINKLNNNFITQNH